MRLSTRGHYAVMALIDLARQGRDKPVALALIAERQELSVHYLEQLFLRLRRQNLVKSVRGQSGGYVLARPASEMTIAEIIEAAEEEVKTTRCKVGGGKSCQGKSEPCLTHHLWHGLGTVIDTYLKGISLEDVAEGRLRAQTSGCVSPEAEVHVA
ncbi:MAG: Rrf2 family transcriptional regulator [Holosporales bacterium]